MAKAIYFDMDGTIADLYGVDAWLDKLMAEDASPYEQARPLVDLEKLSARLEDLRKLGYTIGVISWLSKQATKEYKKQVRQAKREWLKKIKFQFDEIHLVAYGTPKHKVAKVKKGYLVDDDVKVIKDWVKSGGGVIHAKSDKWVDILWGLGE